MKTIVDIIKKEGSVLTKLINKLDDSKELALVFKSVLDKDFIRDCQFANYKILI